MIKDFLLMKQIFLFCFFKGLDDSIRHHTPSYNRFLKQLNDLKQYSSSDGQRILHEEQTSIETRWNQLNRLITDKVRRRRRNLIKYSYFIQEEKEK